MAARIAIIGASGIGKHHANWWTLEGAEVCAFVGTSNESVARTQAILQETVGFRGRGYTDQRRLLLKEQPDFVDICSPHPCHAEQVRLSLEAGCHVLCEKPFVYDASATVAALQAQALELVNLAERQQRQLGVCAQYAAAARVFRRLWDERGGGVITRYCGRLEAPAKGRPADPIRIWTDLSPHVLSVILAWYPDAEPWWDSLEHRFDGHAATASMTIHIPGQPDIACEFQTRNRNEAPTNIREFTFNDSLFTVEAGRDSEGVFCARIVTARSTVLVDDFMRLLIRDSLKGVPTVRGESLLKNLEWMFRILEGRRG